MTVHGARRRFGSPAVRIVAGLAAIVFAAAASAQGPGPQCNKPWPFAVNDANRVAQRDLDRLLSGKTIVYLRQFQAGGEVTDRGRAPIRRFERTFTTQLRADGSLAVTCEERVANSDSFVPCPGFDANIRGARENGIWRTSEGLLCFSLTRVRDGEEVCVSIHRQNDRFAAKRERGSWTCLEGEFAFK